MQGDGGLRIIHCFRSPVGGIFRHVRDLVTAHAADGHEIGIVCDSSTGGEYEAEQLTALRPHLSLGLHRLAISRAIAPADIRSGLESYRTIKNLRPDILHGHGAKGGAFARIIGSRLRASRSRVARFYSPHGGSLHYPRNSLKGRVFFAIERDLERLSEGLFFVCDFEKRAYEAKVGPLRAPSHVVFNGLQTDEFVAVEPEPAASDFLFIGTLRDLKGPDVFVDALAILRKEGKRATAIMVGDGDDKPAIAVRIRESGLEDVIEMRPAMAARKAFALARTVVVPSRAESLPYIVLEALAAGRPVIASAVGGIPEIVGPDSRLLVEAGNAAGLAGVMASALDDPAAFENAMPESTAFRQKFSATTMAGEVADRYRAALAGRTASIS